MECQRSTAIRCSRGGRMPPLEDCPFCEIVAGRAPAHVVDEDALALALLDINPFTQGHCLVISKRHVAWWHELNDDEIASVFQMAKRVANRLGATFAPEFVCMYARGRRVPHTHIFVVPTTKGDVLDGFFNGGRSPSISKLARLSASSIKLAARETSCAPVRPTVSRASSARFSLRKCSKAPVRLMTGLDRPVPRRLSRTRCRFESRGFPVK